MKAVLYVLPTALLIGIAPGIVFGYLDLPIWVGPGMLNVASLYLLAAIIANRVLSVKRTNGMLDTPLADLQTQIDNRRKEIREGLDASRKKLDKLLLKVTVYHLSLVFAFFLLSCGMAITMRATIELTEEMTFIGRMSLITVVCIYFYIMYFPTIYVVSRSSGEMPNFAPSISQKDYPVLYALAKRAADAVGYKGKFRLMLNDDSGFSVDEKDGCVQIYFSPTLLPLCTEKELYAVLVHEFAHAAHNDTRLTAKYVKVRDRYDLTGNKLANLFFSYTRKVISDEIEILSTYSSLVCEMKADDEVISHADAQAHMNATLKSFLYQKVFREPVLQFAYGTYASEVAPNDFYSQKTEYYRGAVPEIYESALEVIMRTLPSRSDSHPTFAMRAQTMGVTTFDPFDYPDEQSDYYKEAVRYAADCDAQLYKYLADDWKQQREENYVHVKEICDKYESDPDSATEATKLLALATYYAIDHDRALPLAEKLLGEDDSYNSVKFYKGMIACARDDQSNFHLVLDAIRDDFNYADAFEFYGDAILRTGKQELLDELREIQPKIGQEIVDKLKALAKKRKRKPSCLQACPQTDRLEKIKTSVRDLVQLSMKDIYMCKVENDDGTRCYELFAPYPIGEHAEKTVSRLWDYLPLLWRKDEIYFVNFCRPNDKFYLRAKEVGTKIA